MKRCVIRFNGEGCYANIPADRLVPFQQDTMIAAIREDGEVVGVFDLSCVLSIYISEVKS